MTFEELNEFYLLIGYERRNRGDRTARNRLVMGRKGIGKLAGFGIAEDIVIQSFKRQNLVQFTLNYSQLRSQQSLDHFEFKPEKDEQSTEASGVKVIFRRLKLKKRINIEDFRRSMARRFALQSGVMAVEINGSPLGKEDLDFEYRTPSADWLEENIPRLGLVRYWFGFLKSPISDAELRGISVFARGRIAQVTPFFFNLTGGINGQVGLEYLTGQVEADFLDEVEDCIATDRQSQLAV